MAYMGKRGDLLRRALRVATGDDDAAMRVSCCDATDGLAGFTIGFRCHRARIHDDDGRIEWGLCTVDRGVDEFLLDGRTLGLRGTATEIRDVKALYCH